jgi:hypothetical protein
VAEMASTRLCNLLGSGAEPVASPAGPFITGVFLSRRAHFPLSRAAHFSPQAWRRVFPRCCARSSRSSFKQSRNSSRRFNNAPAAAVVVANFNKYLRRFLRNSCRRMRNSDGSSDTEVGPAPGKSAARALDVIKKITCMFSFEVVRRELKEEFVAVRARYKKFAKSLLLGNIGWGEFLTVVFFLLNFG